MSLHMRNVLRCSCSRNRKKMIAKELVVEVDFVCYK